MREDPAASEIETLATLLDRANDLKRLPRMGWLLAGVAPAESVAEHSYGVAFLSLLLADAINDGWADEGLAEPLSVERTLRLALLHDLAESLLTDLPKRSSDLIGSAVKHAAEDEAMVALLSTLSDGESFLVLWQEYDAESTPEARLVKDADKLEMVHQALCYEQRGQANLEEFWQGHFWTYTASFTLFKTLLARRK
jgi:putative hydrolase of HD superfamily